MLLNNNVRDVTSNARYKIAGQHMHALVHIVQSLLGQLWGYTRKHSVKLMAAESNSPASWSTGKDNHAHAGTSLAPNKHQVPRMQVGSPK